MVRVRALQVWSCEFESHCFHQKKKRMSISSLILYILSFFTIFFGLLVVTSKNPITSILYLIGTFISSACIFLLFEINLLGLIYIIVYVGAIGILFIFVIMMMDLSKIDSESERKSIGVEEKKRLERSHYPLTIIILSIFISFLIYMRSLQEYFLGSNIFYQDYFSIWEIAQRNIWDSLLISIDLIHSVGYILYTDLLSLLILISLILLMIMVGVIVLIKESK